MLLDNLWFEHQLIDVDQHSGPRGAKLSIVNGTNENQVTMLTMQFVIAKTVWWEEIRLLGTATDTFKWGALVEIGGYICDASARQVQNSEEELVQTPSCNMKTCNILSNNLHHGCQSLSDYQNNKKTRRMTCWTSEHQGCMGRTWGVDGCILRDAFCSAFARSRTLNCALPLDLTGPRLANLQIRSLPIGYDDPRCAHFPCHLPPINIFSKVLIALDHTYRWQLCFIWVYTIELSRCWLQLGWLWKCSLPYMAGNCSKGCGLSPAKLWGLWAFSCREGLSKSVDFSALRSQNDRKNTFAFLRSLQGLSGPRISQFIQTSLVSLQVG